MLRGRVVASDTGSPLRRAQVRAVGGAVRTTRLATTDAEGRYEFANLPPGRYTISVNKAGYVALEFGQRRPFEGGRPLDLGDAQIAEAIDFALPRGSVITGRITDDAGDPIIGASVQALRYQYQPGGQRRLQSSSQSWMTGMTNDLGEYRLFGLMPGTYVVSALAQNFGVVSLTQTGPQTGGVRAIDTRDGHVQTYFPGTASVAEAQLVTVSLSEEADASFSLASARMSRVSGVVRRSDGSAAAGSSISLRPNYVTGGEMGGWGNSPVAGGSFSFANVPPGNYLLEVTPGRDTGPSPEFARMSIVVAGSDMAGLTITTRPGTTASGRVIFPLRTPLKISDGAPVRVTVISPNPEDGARMLYFRPNNGVIDEKGRFELRDLSGQVLFRAGGLPVNLTVKSVMLNGVDVTDTPYEMSHGDITGIEIHLREPGRINGTARNVRGEPMRDFRVALFPANAKPTWATSRFVRAGSADPNGRFEFLTLPAGEYLGVAVEAFEQGEEWNPAFQQRLLPAARRFTVNEGQTLTIELPFVE